MVSSENTIQNKPRKIVSMPDIRYRIAPANPNAHLFHVELEIDQPDANGQSLSLPNWIPGSYLIRDFSKHLIDLQAETASGEPLPITPVEKSHWQVAPHNGPIKVQYDVYAWDLSVRGAHFDQTHAFFNGTSVFLAVDGQRDQACSVEIVPSPYSEAENWRVATTLPPENVNEHGFGLYRADDYLTLIDYPVEMGCFHLLEFEACGIPHQIAFTGKIEFHCIDKKQLLNDLTRICETELELFGQPYPIERYLFQVTVTEKDYGGLEHRDSTALICARSDLPYLNDEKRSDGYIQFLELCSHEYFHTWNVKRIQPEIYQTASLKEPVYTNQLWWFEGITSFYDAQILHRAGILDHDSYLNQLAKEMTRVYRMPGRFKQSVAESSFLTWTKFYQQDENAPNAIVSYYTKGSLIALGLDLTIRAETQNAKSLDDVLLTLWREYGATGKGLQEGEIESICERASGLDLKDFFQRYLFGTEDLPFESLFAKFGIDFTLRPATNAKDTGGKTEQKSFPPQLGANLANTEHQTVKLTHVWNEQSAGQAGLAAGDEIIALSGFKMASVQALESYLARQDIGDVIPCHYFRRDELHETVIHLYEPPCDRVLLEPALKKPDEALEWMSK
jgi:predicted metalloprotease with PDZ domain